MQYTDHESPPAPATPPNTLQPPQDRPERPRIPIRSLLSLDAQIAAIADSVMTAAGGPARDKTSASADDENEPTLRFEKNELARGHRAIERREARTRWMLRLIPLLAACAILAGAGALLYRPAMDLAASTLARHPQALTAAPRPDELAVAGRQPSPRASSHNAANEIHRAAESTVATARRRRRVRASQSRPRRPEPERRVLAYRRTAEPARPHLSKPPRERTAAVRGSTRSESKPSSEFNRDAASIIDSLP